MCQWKHDGKNYNYFAWQGNHFIANIESNYAKNIIIVYLQYSYWEASKNLYQQIQYFDHHNFEKTYKNFQCVKDQAIVPYTALEEIWMTDNMQTNYEETSISAEWFHCKCMYNKMNEP